MSFKAIILVPTRELCEQVRHETYLIAQHCGGGDSEVQVTSLLGENTQQLKRAVAAAGHVVVSTPAKLASAIREGLLSSQVLQSRLQMLILDEADLLLSYGYEEDLQLIAPLVPRACQCMLMSATVSEEVERLNKLILHSPITLNLLNVQSAGSAAGGGALGESTGGLTSETIDHFSYDCAIPDDRLLVTMALLKLGLIKKKCLIFVNTVDRGYQLRLFLESFGIKSAVLNAELPLNSRSHILQTFNKGLFDYLIATDDVHATAHDASASARAGGGGGGGAIVGKKRGREQQLGKDGRRGGGQQQAPKKEEEFGVTRGIDFQGVRTVINYDLPSSVAGYVHRVGRTGRAGQAGVAITLFTPKDKAYREELLGALVKGGGGGGARRKGRARRGAQGADDEDDADSDDDDDDDEKEEEEEADGEEGSAAPSKGPLRTFGRLPSSQVEALRYRGGDIARSITKKVVKEARAKELKAELLNSEKLKDYFEEHAAEKVLLRHDKPLHKAAQAPHLRHIPAYLKDPSIITERSSVGAGGRQPVIGSRSKRRKLSGGGGKGAEGKAKVAKDAAAALVDPLKAMTGFAKVPKRGADAEEELTEMEKRATLKGKKDAKKRAKLEGVPTGGPKSNIRKFKRRR